MVNHAAGESTKAGSRKPRAFVAVVGLGEDMQVKRTGPNPIDKHVGSRVRMRRNMVGLSQEKVADALGLTFQQVQKYEKGTNRISSSRLHQLARILEVPIPFFFDGAPQQSAKSQGKAESLDFVSDL